MKETPITILEKQVDFYKSFIVKLETRDGLDNKAPQDKLDNLIKECRIKIIEFKNAITILNSIIN